MLPFEHWRLSAWLCTTAAKRQECKTRHPVIFATSLLHLGLSCFQSDMTAVFNSQRSSINCRLTVSAQMSLTTSFLNAANDDPIYISVKVISCYRINFKRMQSKIQAKVLRPDGSFSASIKDILNACIRSSPSDKEHFWGFVGHKRASVVQPPCLLKITFSHRFTKVNSSGDRS